MLRYITSLIGFANTTSNTPASRSFDHDPAPQQASCRPWTRPNTAVRLRVKDTAIRIFGFPRQGSLPPGLWIPFGNIGSSGPPLLHVRGSVPAYVKYIMGDDWRSQLREDRSDERLMYHGGEVILRPKPSERGDDGEEQAHCLRMLRCGAFAIRAEPDIPLEESRGPPELEQLFGWPASGGVWILRGLPVGFPRDSRSEEEELEYEEMSTRLYEVAEEVQQQADMEGICRLLKEAGAQFYGDMAKCPEVVKLGLLG